VSEPGGSKPATDPQGKGLTTPEVLERRCALAAGHTGDVATALELWNSTEPSVRAAAISALDRSGGLNIKLITDALRDPSWEVRRRACEVAALQIPEFDRSSGDSSDKGVGTEESLVASVTAKLEDAESLVVEAAAWALGELVPKGPTNHKESVDATLSLGEVATNHPDPVCREAAVAALGAIGEPTSVEVVLRALDDKQPIRRRATVALAAFDDPRVDQALKQCLSDRDWQVRQAAEDLLGRPLDPGQEK